MISYPGSLALPVIKWKRFWPTQRVNRRHLFSDENPAGSLRPSTPQESFTGHEVNHAYELGWQELRNGDLLAKAEQDFQLLITSDKNIAHQQMGSGKKLAILVLWTNNWPELRIQSARIVAELDNLIPGTWQQMD